MRGALRLRIRSKLFLTLVSLITLSVLVAYVSARSEIERDARRRITEDLIVRAHLVAHTVELATHGLNDLASWDALADRLGSDAAARVTIVAKDGAVLGDSEVSTAELAYVDNHGSRPEIVQAMSGALGKSRRHSATVDGELVYVALPLQRGGEMVGVARVAMQLTQINTTLSSLREALIISAALALFVAFLVTSLAVQLVSRTALSLTDSARRMAAGDLHVRIRTRGHDEFADLGRALNQLAKNLSSTLGALREESDRMSGILANMDEGVLFLDVNGRVALINPKLREMLVLQGRQEGNTLLESIRHTELLELLGRADVGNPVEGEIEVTGLRPSKLMVRATKLEGAHQGVLAVFVDVTETRRLENIRREFVANVSHELRTPVTSIRSAGESLSAALSQPEMAQKFVDIIDRNGERLQVLVEDLLELSRIESRQYSPTPEPLDVGPFLIQMLGLFSERAQRVKVKLTTEFEPGVPLAHADRRALEHVVTNLVDNAIKYAGPGRQVVVSVRGSERRVLIRVSDNGPGIPENHLPRIFERFYRIDAGRSRELGGTGLGLSIVKNLTESMDGSVRVESQEGVGTTFEVSLPRAPETGQSAA